MSGMDQFLAEYYGTNGTAQANDEETKLAAAAELELFGKLAAANGIDLNALSDAQVEQLYAETFSKEAEFPPGAGTKAKDHEKDDRHENNESKDKREEAAKEHEEKKASQEKVAEADFLGRVMAHSYVQELNKIAASKEMVHVPGHGSSSSKGHDKGQLFDRKSDAVKPGRGSLLARRARVAAGDAGKAIGKAAKNVATHVGKHSGKYGLGGAALAAGGTAAAMHKKSSGSALDELASIQAYEKAAAAGWDAEEAAQRIEAVMVLGPTDEDSKVASVATLEEAVDVRSSEILELAGYPVNWE